jgi:putative spermidine/putrescine transport system substrate-binding protein
LKSCICSISILWAELAIAVERSCMSTDERRSISRWLAAALCLFSTLFFAVGFARSASAQNTVVFAGWGGSIQAAQRKVIFDNFTKETGIRVIDVPDVSLAKIKVMVDSGDVQWDVAQALGMWIPLGEADNLWEKLDYKAIDANALPKAFRRDFGIGNSAYGQVLAFNRKEMKDQVIAKSWSDFWDINGKPGGRALQDGPRYCLEFALLADGVPRDSLYPLDVERAFTKLDSIKLNIGVWWKQPPQVPPLLASGEVVMSNTSHTRILDLVKKERVPVEIVWTDGLITVDFLGVPRGAKNKENAMKLIAYMTRPDVQAALAKETGIGPTNNEALSKLSDEEKAQLPSYHYQKGEMVLFDNDWWAKNNDAMIQRWDAWKLK